MQRVGIIQRAHRSDSVAVRIVWAHSGDGIGVPAVAVGNDFVAVAWTDLFQGLLVAVALIVGGFGIANSKKWGYWLAVGATSAGILLTLWLPYTMFSTLVSLVFQGALLGLLLHPQSRDYMRIWFE